MLWRDAREFHSERIAADVPAELTWIIERSSTGDAVRPGCFLRGIFVAPGMAKCRSGRLSITTLEGAAVGGTGSSED